MDSAIKKVLHGQGDETTHQYFVRYGKGTYQRRFILNLAKTKAKIKLRGSFEWANDFVAFARSLGKTNFSGVVLMREKIPGKAGKKKKGAFAYELNEEGVEDFENAYFYLLNHKSDEVVLKVKKSLPKPGKDAEKIDDKFCQLDLDMKHWEAAKETFFWDVPDCKKASINHTLHITDIVLPTGESDPAKMRELAKRAGTITRKITCDCEESSKDYEVEA